MRDNRLRVVKPENYAGNIPDKAGIRVLKRNEYFVLPDNVSVGGDAPKELIRLYDAKISRKQSKRTWPIYIAKSAGKWYPTECITEYLMNRLGEVLGLQMAKSKLVYANNQVRFLSKYFLKPNQELIHGADIYAGYLNDKPFVEELEKNDKYVRQFITVDFTHEALRRVFPEAADEIFGNFCKMLLFDAYVGNNDRHFYNWGVIRSAELDGKPKQLTFSPIYDTSRGLFWNESDKALQMKPATIQAAQRYIVKYAEGSRSKTGWEGFDSPNHFTIAEKLCQLDDADTFLENFMEPVFPKWKSLLIKEFFNKLHPTRFNLILKYLEYRCARIDNIIKSTTTR